MARMPPTRSQPLNPQVAGLPIAPPRAAVPPVRRTAPAAPAPEPPSEDDADDARAEAARAGGFHESSYELKLGLEVSESEWPDDTTIPGRLGER